MTVNANEKGASFVAVRAVPYDEQFLEKSWAWLQDDEIRRLTMTPSFSREQQRAWFAGLSERKDYLVWGIEADGEPVGAFGLKNIEDASGEYWGYIGDKAYWGKGIGRWMVREALEQARRLGIKHVYLKVWQENTRAIKLYEKFGFKTRTVDGDVIWMDAV